MSLPIGFVKDGDVLDSTKYWPGGRGTFAVLDATFNSATLTLRWRIQGSTGWINLAEMVANGTQNFEIGPGEIDLEITGGTPTGHTVQAIPL